MLGISASKEQRNASRAAGAISKQQAALFKQAAPLYMPTVQELYNRTGIGGGGVFNAPQTRLQLQAGEEDINEARGRSTDTLLADLQRRGIRGPAAAAALSRVAGDADTELARFRRQLALQADQEQERRLMQLLNSLGVGFGQGLNAQQAYTGLANSYGQQAAATRQGLFTLGAAFA